MDYIEVGRLADMLRETLEEELKAGQQVVAAQDTADRMEAAILHGATTDGRIDGKNEKARELQRVTILNGTGEYKIQLSRIVNAKATVSMATLDRKHAEALIGLTKAWLNSQSGVR